MANKIDIKTVDEVAHLARLEFTDSAKEEILNDMNRMLGFIDKLNELNTDNIEPLIYMTNEKNILRDDIPEITLTQKEALKNAPKKDSDYFKAPKVIDQNN
ncbi:MAG: Asp-tRNA(Asn)/Glu-tRNA(Gln) amidotransferase subunit GatC [Bacteroidota bacterium]|nr:Asp-tRNA(Asn)/Glu-tRNA(Gln) amidotransferase subunit GatC [Bacteroidota bacterium]MDP3146335.1 Asp-tRNA(Asn)/Glu-tRNA(Gln) amidotransferase subunit GatC [Bacteroidota bacterium]MDP3556593.1 Asp-tRNA(Asn)/Glu-tRNA(Gln) amidotransferase subunit GatC [Bacteroidota bacterium]